MKYAQCVCFLPLFCFLVAGCAIPENQGRLVRAGDVDRLIESATILPNHTYYYTGPEARPDAIIAIDNSLTLRSKYWIRVDDDVADRLTMWNRLIDNATRYRSAYDYEGARIMTPDGRQVGVWYSIYDHTVVRFPDASTIIIYAPLIPSERDIPSLRDFGWRN